MDKEVLIAAREFLRLGLDDLSHHLPPPTRPSNQSASSLASKLA